MATDFLVGKFINIIVSDQIPESRIMNATIAFYCGFKNHSDVNYSRITNIRHVLVKKNHLVLH